MQVTQVISVLSLCKPRTGSNYFQLPSTSMPFWRGDGSNPTDCCPLAWVKPGGTFGSDHVACGSSKAVVTPGWSWSNFGSTFGGFSAGCSSRPATWTVPTVPTCSVCPPVPPTLKSPPPAALKSPPPPPPSPPPPAGGCLVVSSVPSPYYFNKGDWYPTSGAHSHTTVSLLQVSSVPAEATCVLYGVALQPEHAAVMMDYQRVKPRGVGPVTYASIARML